MLLKVNKAIPSFPEYLAQEHSLNFLINMARVAEEALHLEFLRTDKISPADYEMWRWAEEAIAYKEI